MDYQEFKNMEAAMRHSGLSDDNIMQILVETYETGKCDIEDLEIMVNWLGYSLTEEFYKVHNEKPHLQRVK